MKKIAWTLIIQPSDGGPRRVLDSSSAFHAHRIGREKILDGSALAYSVARYTAHMKRGAVPL